MNKRIIIAATLLVLAIAAWGTRTYLMHRKISETNACVSGNLLIIDAAKEQWAMATRTTNSPVDVAGVMQYMIKGQMPICPAGGQYTFGNIGENPSCSIHGTYDDRRYPKWWK